MKKRLILIILIELFIFSAFSQQFGIGLPPVIQASQVPVEHPSVDKNWKVIFQDNFDSFNTSRWYKANNMIHGTYNPDEGKKSEEPQIYMNSNVDVANGKLVLETLKLENDSIKCPKVIVPADTVKCQYNGWHKYTSGWVQSRKKYKYGYYEIYSTMPVSDGYWAAFWLWAAQNDIPNNNCWYNEIDVFETNGCKKSVESRVHWGFNCPHSIEGRIDEMAHEANNYDSVYRWYGVGWNSDKITWYVDKKEVRQISNNMMGIGIQNPMYIIMNVALFPPTWHCPVSINSIFPNYMHVDQSNVYSLKCDSDTPVNEILDFDNFNYAVKQSITLSGTSSIPKGKRIALRATDFIELKAGFEVPAGTELYLGVHPCNETVIE